MESGFESVQGINLLDFSPWRMNPSRFSSPQTLLDASVTTLTDLWEEEKKKKKRLPDDSDIC